MRNMPKDFVRVAVSGGFDPLHPAHLDHMEEASRLGNWLVVILNTDEFLMRKKGWVALPFLDRARIIHSLPFVDQIVPCIDRDQSVAETIRLIKPNIFAKGGDRDPSKVAIPKPETDACEEVGCRIVYGVDRKVRASSTDFYLEAANLTSKPWGYEKMIFRDETSWLKVMHLWHGEEISLQHHTGREEKWRVTEGLPVLHLDGEEKHLSLNDFVDVPVTSEHRLSAPYGDVTIMEMSRAVLLGAENDIVRHEDKYGRS